MGFKSTIYKYSTKIGFQFSPEPIRLPEDQRAIINNHWKAQTEKNSHLFNGSVISLGAIDSTENGVTLKFNQTDYAHYLASDSGLLPRGICCRSLYVSALIETSDNRVAFAQMGDMSFDPGRYQYIGGGIDHNHILEGTIDFSRCMKEELVEELGLVFDKDTFPIFQPFFVSFGLEKRKISVIFRIRVNLESKDLCMKLNAHNAGLIQQGKTPEVAGFVFVDESTYQNECLKIDSSKIDENLYSSLHAFFSGDIEEDYAICLNRSFQSKSANQPHGEKFI